MNDSLAQDLSIYQLALAMQAPPQALPLNPATLLSLLRSQIDLLIEQKIAATLWVKLPPGKIWQSELWRYQSAVDISAVIYNCQIDERRKGETIESKYQSQSLDDLVINLLPNKYLQREYFFIVLSPQFCSLILAHRPPKRRKTNILKKGNSRKTVPLLAMTTVEGRVIQRVLDGIKQVRTPESASILQADFLCPSVPDSALMNQLLVKQVKRQDEINHQLMTKRIAKLQQQNQKLYKKAQIKDDYLSNACQELRTPLTHMKTALSLLNSPTLKPPQRQRYLQMLNIQCDRQNSLISGLLDLVHLDRNLQDSPLESVCLADVVPGIVSTYQPVAQEKGIMLAYTVPTELPSVWCVSGGLRLIVINLLHNSIKFTPSGGQVWVRSRVHNDYVQLEVRDTGIGIAETEITKIFDSFYRVRSGATDESSGPGLGLTVVQQLLWRSGGFISLRSKLNEGSTFTVNLPIVRDRPV
ncbi:MAG: DICT sensory domain-containing protein [Aulosira sp. ZfuVER01]|nr:DICT sensory domain-containing protein [Aulosira sp. ZfuVER01]MDZ8002284.1 DICT sensory domain-containing protein [Aulosira sp. DedVER01a]MDZ8052712.1 DICT sensory domain-containing protein [Aulosira sp. ZfuCHP01]